MFPFALYLFVIKQDQHNPTLTINIAESVGEPMKPMIAVNYADTIGSCDDLTTNAILTNIGGRQPQYIWRANGTTITTDANTPNILQYDMAPNTSANITLTVMTWYNQVNSLSFMVRKESIPLPIINIEAPKTYNKYENNFQDFIQITSNIEFNNDCDNSVSNQEYNITWNVEIRTIYDEVNVNTTRLNALKGYLSDNENKSALNLDVNSLLQVGIEYTFSMSLNCIDDGCGVAESHAFRYEYSQIQCNILQNDINLGSITPESLNIWEMGLDGYLMTFDPDTALSRSNLQWQWKCMNNNSDCGNILEYRNESIANVLFSNETEYIIGNTYNYEIIMIVSDVLTSKPPCHDSINIQYTVAENITDTLNGLLVSLVAIDNTINVNEKVRIVSEVYNDKGGLLQYEWSEINGGIQVNKSLPNLIIDGNTLTEGAMCTFVLNVNEYDEVTGDLVSSGTGMVSVYVNKKPVIIRNSFIVLPNGCGNIVYNNISEAINSEYKLLISGDGDNLPLSYRFGYNIIDSTRISNIHSSYLFNGELNNVILPIGNYKFYGYVYDAMKSFDYDTISCNVSVINHDCGMPYDYMINDKAQEIRDQQSMMEYVLKTSQVYLSYVDNYDDDMDRLCVLKQLDAILAVNHDFFASRMDELCESNNVMILSDVVYNWINILLSDNIYINHFLTDLNDTILLSNLIQTIYDPCNYYNNIITDFDLLSISYQSLVLKKPIIYYNDMDITKYISPFILSMDDDKFYGFISQIVKLLNNFYIQNEHINEGNIIYSYVKYGLYLYELIKSSLHIPNELNQINIDNSITIFSTKINEESVNITIQNISVIIGSEVTSKNNPNILDGNDIFIFGFNNSISNVTYNTESNIDCPNSVSGELNSEVVSINIVGDVNTSTLNGGNVSISFKVSEISNDSTCVFLDEINNVWRDDGCTTEYNTDTNTVTCICSHLTTFSIISNIQNTKACNQESLSIYSNMWIRVTMVIGALYLIIIVCIIYTLSPFLYNKALRQYITHASLRAVHVILLISFFELGICVQFFILRSNISKVNQDILSILLLVPQALWFVIFSMIYLAWYNVSHSMDSDIMFISQKIKFRLKCFNIFTLILLVALGILVLFDIFTIYLYIIQAFWVFSIIITCITLIYYGYKMTSLLVETERHMSEVSIHRVSVTTDTTKNYGETSTNGDTNDSDNSTRDRARTNTLSQISSVLSKVKDKITERNPEQELIDRFRIVNIIIALYFVYKLIETIYLCIHPTHLNVSWYIANSCGNLITLISIGMLFRKPINVLKENASENDPEPEKWSPKSMNNNGYTTSNIKNRVRGRSYDTSTATDTHCFDKNIPDIKGHQTHSIAKYNTHNKIIGITQLKSATAESFTPNITPQITPNLKPSQLSNQNELNVLQLSAQISNLSNGSCNIDSDNELPPILSTLNTDDDIIDLQYNE